MGPIDNENAVLWNCWEQCIRVLMSLNENYVVLESQWKENRREKALIYGGFSVCR